MELFTIQEIPYSLRNGRELLESFSSNDFHNSTVYRLERKWNEHPTNISTLDNLSLFKDRSKTLLL